MTRQHNYFSASIMNGPVGEEEKISQIYALRNACFPHSMSVPDSSAVSLVSFILLAVEALALKQSMMLFAFLDSSRTLTRLTAFESLAFPAGLFFIVAASGFDDSDTTST